VVVAKSYLEEIEGQR